MRLREANLVNDVRSRRADDSGVKLLQVHTESSSQSSRRTDHPGENGREEKKKEDVEEEEEEAG